METIEFFGVKYRLIKYSKHPNGGGIVSSEAEVDESAYVGPEVVVWSGAKIKNDAKLVGKIWVREKAFVCGNAVIDGRKNFVEIGDTIIGGNWYINKSTARGIHE